MTTHRVVVKGRVEVYILKPPIQQQNDSS